MTCILFTTYSRTTMEWFFLLYNDYLKLFLLLIQSAVDGGQRQQRLQLSLQVLRPLTLQTVPRWRRWQRRRPQRHLCQLQWFGPGRRECQLPLRFSGGTWEKGKEERRDREVTAKPYLCKRILYSISENLLVILWWTVCLKVTTTIFHLRWCCPLFLVSSFHI